MSSNRVALITGASQGLGKAIAEEYAKHGYNLVLVGRNKNKLEALSRELTKYAVAIIIKVCDISSVSQLLEMTDSLENTNIDILVNCAGAFPVKKISDMSLKEYDECMQVNVRAPFLLIRELSRNMIKNRWGRIINIASSSAYGGAPLTSVYCASKHALLGLSRSLYKELKDDNIRVLCVSPGSIKTEMGREVEKLGQIFDTFMEPTEVAKYVVYNSSFDGNMVAEEIRLNRVFVQ